MPSTRIKVAAEGNIPHFERRHIFGEAILGACLLHAGELDDDDGVRLPRSLKGFDRAAAGKVAAPLLGNRSSGPGPVGL